MSHDALRCMLRQPDRRSDRTDVGETTGRGDFPFSSELRLAKITMVMPTCAA